MVNNNSLKSVDIHLREQSKINYATIKYFNVKEDKDLFEIKLRH